MEERVNVVRSDDSKVSSSSDTSALTFLALGPHDFSKFYRHEAF
jgi:hypothetical protein